MRASRKPGPSWATQPSSSAITTSATKSFVLPTSPATATNCLKVAAETNAKFIVFCGVHFMAESADVLGHDGQQVILPDHNAGCSMADMAEISQVENCWDAFDRQGLTSEIVPITYMNSTAAIKAFCGENGGLVCTSSNARAAFEWAFARGKRILFLPDQHLGRNTGHALGIPLDEMTVWDPWALQGGQTKDKLA